MNITGVSCYSCIGSNLQMIAANLNQGVHGLTSKHRFSEGTPAILGEINLDITRDKLDRLTNLVLDMVDELNRKSDCFHRYKPEEIGFFFGTTTASYDESIDCMNQRLRASEDRMLQDYLTATCGQGALTTSVRSSFPIRGLSMIFSTACSSGTVALGEAYHAIRRGRLKACIAGGADILNLTTILGFNSLQVLSYDLCKPFQSDRKGMNLAEGGALFLLEKEASDADIWARIVGYGASSDGYHLTHPHPEGKGMALAMQRALKDAGLPPGKIGYINAHGTGTVSNDAAELMAIHHLFGQEIPFSSTKRFHGHLLGSWCLRSRGFLSCA